MLGIQQPPSLKESDLETWSPRIRCLLTWRSAMWSRKKIRLAATLNRCVLFACTSHAIPYTSTGRTTRWHCCERKIERNWFIEGDYAESEDAELKIFKAIFKTKRYTAAFVPNSRFDGYLCIFAAQSLKNPCLIWQQTVRSLIEIHWTWMHVMDRSLFDVYVSNCCFSLTRVQLHWYRYSFLSERLMDEQMSCPWRDPMIDYALQIIPGYGSSKFISLWILFIIPFTVPRSIRCMVFEWHHQ